jgi:hypothetical protein
MEAPRIGGAGRGNGATTENTDGFTAPARPRQRRMDARAVWLLRAASRYDLLRDGLMTLDEVFDAEFVADLLDAVPDACPCNASIGRHFDDTWREDRQRELRRWRAMKPRLFQDQPPPQSALDAFHFLVRANNPERLRLWLEQRHEMRAWLKRNKQNGSKRK